MLHCFLIDGEFFFSFFLVDCSFNKGVCNWKQDTDDDFDWNPADRDNGI